MTPAEFLAQHAACADGRAFALKYTTMAEVWDACQRPDWLMWILARLPPEPITPAYPLLGLLLVLLSVGAVGLLAYLVYLTGKVML